MKRTLTILLMVLLVCLMPVCPIQALEDYTPEAIVADTLVVRPACFVVTAFGSVFFVVALPWAAASGSTKKTAESLIVKPAKATFTRPLGNFTDLP
jgi:hypothetical protein